jgi:hypothetical protein
MEPSKKRPFDEPRRLLNRMDVGAGVRPKSERLHVAAGLKHVLCPADSRSTLDSSTDIWSSAQRITAYPLVG